MLSRLSVVRYAPNVKVSAIGTRSPATSPKHTVKRSGGRFLRREARYRSGRAAPPRLPVPTRSAAGLYIVPYRRRRIASVAPVITIITVMAAAHSDVVGTVNGEHLKLLQSVPFPAN